MNSLSIVVPVFNEVENIARLHSEIVTVCKTNDYEYEIIFVDDGSTDGTIEVLKQLKPLKIVRFRRNFGQTAAMDAGIKNAGKDLIITMDGDGQNDPADIPKMIDFLNEKELDVVSGWRKNRKDNFLKRFVSRGANLLRKLFVDDGGIHDSGCSLKVYKRECFNSLSLYGEMHRFIPGLLKIKGFIIGEVPVNHRPRIAGTTKYTWKRTIKGFVDMISVWFWNKFAVRPLHLLGGLGLILIFGGVIFGTATLVYFLKGGNMSNTALPLVTMFLTFSGIQLFVFGLVADILMKSYFETTRDSSYSILEILEEN